MQNIKTITKYTTYVQKDIMMLLNLIAESHNILLKTTIHHS